LKRTTLRRLIATFFLFAGLHGVASATEVLLGSFTADGNETVFLIDAPTNTTLTVQSLGYGGFGIILGGGFATSLSLYDSSGNQLDHDFVGGTAIGASCSNGAQQDSSTHLCEDAGFAFPILAGSYSVYLTEQGNDGPDPLSNGFLLNFADNFSPGPFNDPGVPGGAQRTANWAVAFDSTAPIFITQINVPEPASALLGCFGLIALAVFKVRARSRS
jgi:hypothetical protein